MPGPSKNPIRDVIETTDEDREAQIEGARRGRPSLFICPECGGTMWQLDEPELLQFRCHVGHILTGEALLQEQTRAAENGIWYTIRTLTDKMVLSRELAEFARRHGKEEAARDFDEQADRAQQKADTLRQIAESPP